MSDPVSPEIKFGELLDALDTDNRWVYKGSLTTPRCDRLVYWNILSKVYPISKKHFESYKHHMNFRPDYER